MRALQMLQAEAEQEIGRLSSELQQLQVHACVSPSARNLAAASSLSRCIPPHAQLQAHAHDTEAKGKQVKELSRRAIEKLDAALRDEKATVRTLKSRAQEAEERERRVAEAHSGEVGVLQKRLRAAELRSKELQAS